MSTTKIAVLSRCLVLRLTLIISGENFQQYRNNFKLNLEEKVSESDRGKCECQASTQSSDYYAVEICPRDEKKLIKFLRTYCKKCDIELAVE